MSGSELDMDDLRFPDSGLNRLYAEQEAAIGAYQDRQGSHEIEADEIIVTLATMNPYQDTGVFKEHKCFFCGEPSVKNRVHKPDCIWLRARNIVGLET